MLLFHCFIHYSTEHSETEGQGTLATLNRLQHDSACSDSFTTADSLSGESQKQCRMICVDVALH